MRERASMLKLYIACLAIPEYRLSTFLTVIGATEHMLFIMYHGQKLIFSPSSSVSAVLGVHQMKFLGSGIERY